LNYQLTKLIFNPLKLIFISKLKTFKTKKMNMLKKQNFLLGITFLMSVYNGFAQLPSDGQNQEPLGGPAPINDFIVPMLLIAILFAGYFFRLHNKELKKSSETN
jgi:hypothetical protein